HESGRERRGQAVHQQSQRDRERDRPPRPAEVVLERDDEDARGRPEPGRGDERYESDADDEPGVVTPAVDQPLDHLERINDPGTGDIRDRDAVDYPTHAQARGYRTRSPLAAGHRRHRWR